MTTTSQRASNFIKSMPVDQNDRDHLREQWRLLAVAFAVAEDKAIRAREGKTIFLDALIETLLQQNAGLTGTKAERMARTSKAFADYIEQMHKLRHAARLAEIEEKNADRIYWQCVGNEAQSRAEMRMR